MTYFRVGDDTVALFEAKAGLIYTEGAVHAHLDLANCTGAKLRFEEPALRWTGTPGEVWR